MKLKFNQGRKQLTDATISDAPLVNGSLVYDATLNRPIGTLVIRRKDGFEIVFHTFQDWPRSK